MGSINATTCTAQYLITNRFSELKKNLTINKFNDMHSDNLNFVSSERGWFFQNGKTDSFQKREDLLLLEVTAETGLWYGLSDGSLGVMMNRLQNLPKDLTLWAKIRSIQGQKVHFVYICVDSFKNHVNIV